MCKAGIGKLKLFLTFPPVAAPLHTHAHTHINMPPWDVTICRGVAMFLHRVIVMQANVGPRVPLSLSAGHCLIMLHGGSRGPDLKLSRVEAVSLSHLYSWSFFLKLRTFSFLFFHPFFLFGGYRVPNKTQDAQRCAQTRAHTHTRAHPDTQTNSWWTALHVQSAGDVNEEARSFQQHGPRGCKARCPSYIWGLGIFCPCPVTVSHMKPLLMHVAHHPFTQAPAHMNVPVTGRGPASGVDSGQTLATAVLYGFLSSYNQRRQAGKRLRQLEKGMLQRMERIYTHTHTHRF